jgi:Tfp pilus assembly protein PilF
LQIQPLLPAALMCLLPFVSLLAGCTQSNTRLAKDWQSLRLVPAIGGGLLAGDSARADDEAKGPLALARLSERRGQTEQAEQLYQKMIERFSDNPLSYHRLGVMRSRAGKWEEAETYFQQALRLNPDSPDLLADVGYFYYLRSMPEEAEKHLRRALEIEPNHANSCNNLAILLGEQRRDEECLALFRRTGSEAVVWCNMAFVYAQRGDLNQAIESYSRALTYDDSLRPAAEALAQLARYHPPATSLDGTAPGDAKRQPEVSHLVYMIERKIDATAPEDKYVRPASAEIVPASSGDEDGTPSKASVRGGQSSVQTHVTRDPIQLDPAPSIPGSFPSGWQPPLPATPSGQNFNNSRPAGVQLPYGSTPVSPLRLPAIGSSTTPAVSVGNERP